jgi:hypothetical protein
MLLARATTVHEYNQSTTVL